MTSFGLPELLVISGGAVALLSPFLAVASWSNSRRREREAYYKSELLKKISEIPGDGALALLREHERSATSRHREGIRLGGMVTAAVGIGVMTFLRALAPNAPLYLVGSIPLLIGAALLFYSYVLAPKD